MLHARSDLAYTILHGMQDLQADQGSRPCQGRFLGGAKDLKDSTSTHCHEWTGFRLLVGIWAICSYTKENRGGQRLDGVEVQFSSISFLILWAS